MKDGKDANAGAEVLGVGCDGDQRLGRGLEQDAVDRGLVLVGDVGNLRGKREYYVIVRHRQQLGLALGEPFLRGGTLAFGAMPIATGVIGDLRVRALLAARDMPAEGRRATALDRRHHLELAEAHMAGIGLAPCRSMAAENIRDLQRWTRHTAAL